jgi:hypothetical protein
LFFVSRDKVRWAIDGFGTLRAAGGDGIFPGLLQHRIEIIIVHIAIMFAACLAYGYIPFACWAVSLTSFFLKTRTGYSDNAMLSKRSVLKEFGGFLKAFELRSVKEGSGCS